MNYPALLVYENIDELIYIESESEWKSSSDLISFPHPPSSYIIDIRGEKYSISYDKKSKKNQVENSNSSICIDTFSDLVRGHLFFHAQTCISKVILRSFDEGFQTVKAYQD